MMSTTVITEPITVSSADLTASANAAAATSAVEIEWAECDCCGLTEECTPAYIEGIRERYMGKWICGLCAEAVKDEMVGSENRLVGTEEALNRHLNVCKKFRSSWPPASDPTLHLITAVRQIFRRSLDGPRSTPVSPTKSGERMKRPALARSGSCFSPISG